MAAGHDQWFARPGAGVTYAVVFGVIGAHPLVAYLLSAALVAVAAESLRRLLLVVRLPPAIALATALVWVVAPNHGSLLYWASAANITLALVLLLRGLAADPGWVQVALLTASVLCYEATLPTALVGLVVVPRLRAGVWQRRPLLRATPFLGAAAAWMVVFFHPSKRGIDHWASFDLAFPAHFGWGMFAWDPVARAAGVSFAVGAAVLLARRRPLGTEGWMVVAGLGTIVVGTLPFVRYFYAPLGAGDRVNVVAAVGAALAWSGAGAVAFRLARPVALAVTVVLAAAAFAGQAEAVDAWADAARDGRAVYRALEAGATRVEQPPVRRNVGAFLDQSNVDGAADLARGGRGPSIELVTGPE